MIELTPLSPGWSWSSIQDIAASKRNAVVDGPFGSNLKTSDYVEDGIPVLQGKNITAHSFRWFDVRFISEQKAEELARSKVYVGDVLIVKIGSIGYAAELSELNGYPYAIIPANLAKITIDEKKIDKRYLLHWLKTESVERHLKQIASKTAQPALSLTKIKELPIPLPPMEEQKRIAAILDKGDAIRRKRQQAIDLTDQLLRSVFLDMFGDPVTNNKNWGRVSLESVCRKITDGTHHSPEPQSEGVPYITAKHLKPNRLDFYSKPTYVSEEAHKEIYSRCNPEINDVLYIKDGATTGAAAINPYNFEFSMLSSLALIKVDTKKLIPEYLCDWLNFESVKENILKNMSGAAITRLTIRKIKDIIIELPPINLQKEYLGIREKIMGKTKKLSASMVEADNLFNSLSQQAFRGELGSKTKAA